MAYGNGRFVAVGDEGIIWSSADGLLWSVLQLVSGKTLREVKFNGSSFLVVVPLNNPAGASSAKVRFGMLTAANDWWWAVGGTAALWSAAVVAIGTGQF